MRVPTSFYISPLVAFQLPNKLVNTIETFMKVFMIALENFDRFSIMQTSVNFTAGKIDYCFHDEFYRISPTDERIENLSI